MMNHPYFRSSANASTLKKTTTKRKSSLLGGAAYFSPSSGLEDPSSRSDDDSSKSSLSDDDVVDDNVVVADDDDDRSVSTAGGGGSVASVRSSFSKGARLLKKTATAPVYLAARTTKTMARRSYQVVQGTSHAVGNTGKALAHGTTYVVRGGSKALVGGTTVLASGTTAVVKGSSKALYQGTTALMGGTTAVTLKTVRGLQQGAAHMRPGHRRLHGSRRAAAHHHNQWEFAMETLDEILRPGSAVHQALSATQRRSLRKVKKMLLLPHQGGGGGGAMLLSSPTRGGGDQTSVACLPVDLIQIEQWNQQQQQRMQRRNSNTSSVDNGSILHHESSSVQSDASYILQEYGGIRNPSALLMADNNDSEEFDEDLCSELSMSDNRGDGYLMSLLAESSVTEESGSDALVVVEPQSATTTTDGADTGDDNVVIDVEDTDDVMDVTPKTTTTTAANSSSPRTDRRRVVGGGGGGHKTKKKLPSAVPRAPPPTVSVAYTAADMKEKDMTYTKSLPLEFHQLGGRERQRQVYHALRWDRVASWDYDIFDLDRFTGGNALLFMGWAILGAPYAQYAMAHACDLATDDETFVGYPFMDKLNIPPQKLIQYLRVIQGDYHAENPYHNAVHAADVLQTVHAMIQMALRTDPGEVDGGGDEQQAGIGAKVGFFVRSCPNHLKLFSILLAAAVHDVDHPGKNNGFHMKLKAELAVVYNDKSVLENWHIAHAFGRMLGLDLLNRSDFHKHTRIRPGKTNGIKSSSDHLQASSPNHADCECNLLCNASANDFEAIRSMMIEAVLQTDMTKHFAIVTEIKGMLMLIEEEEKSTGAIGHDDDRTWSLLMFMLHQADISGQTKADPLFLSWTDRCMQEFFAQGDQEAALGMRPISPYCNRETTNQAVAQTGFVEFVVQPSFEVLGGYIPRIREYVLPIIQDNLEFWYDASGKQLIKVEEEGEEKGAS